MWRRAASTALLCLWIATPAGALPEAPDAGAWGAEGEVYAIARHNETTYIGGEFHYVGPHTGSALALSSSDAGLQPGFPQVNGHVRAVEPDGNGGWYIGGSFTQVGGESRPLLARLGADGSLDPAFAPQITGGAVWDIELGTGGGVPGTPRLFVAGAFTQVDGTDRRNAAALSPSDGSLEADWNAGAPAGSTVNELALHPNGQSIYVGGTFSSMRGFPRTNFAELNTWNAAPYPGCAGSGVNGPVEAIELNAGGGRIYIGGSFSSAFGVTRNGIAGMFNDCVVETGWNPDITGGGVADIALSADATIVYAGGTFTAVAGESRRKIAAIGASSGDATSWDPNPSAAFAGGSPRVTTVDVAGSTIYVGGTFSRIGGQARNGLAAIDASGEVAGWDANLGNSPYDVKVSGSTVFVGGAFSTAKGVNRTNLAALDASGAATDWNPRLAGSRTVYALAPSPDGQTIYIGGNFSPPAEASDGERRNHLAAADAAGNVTGWDPHASGSVHALEVSPDGSTVYAGGSFAAVGGAARDNLAALEASSGLATGWNPDPDGNVEALLLRPGGSRLLVGGDVTSFHGGLVAVDYLAEVSTGSDAVTHWKPNLDDEVYALALSPDGATVYAGGAFNMVGGHVRNHIAAISSSSAEATDWNPDASTTVWALGVSEDGSSVFAGGDFSSRFGGRIGGAPGDYLAELDAATGAATGWNPGADDSVLALETSGPDLFAGGDFNNMGARPRAAFAQFTAPRPPAEPAPGSSPTSTEPPADAPPSQPQAGDTQAPGLSGVSATNRRFRVGRRATPVAVGARRRRVPVGTTFRWTLSEPAQTRIAIRRERKGLRLGGRCRPASRSVRRRVRRAVRRQVRTLSGRRQARRFRALMRRRRCTALRRAGVLRRAGQEGRNSLRFSGRIGRRALRRGRYRAVFRATDAAGNRSARERVRFRVVPLPKRKRARGTQVGLN